MRSNVQRTLVPGLVNLGPELETPDREQFGAGFDILGAF